jgi:spore maturation protein CgeB
LDYQSYGDKIELGRWMSPAETNDTYNGSKIVINLHFAWLVKTSQIVSCIRQLQRATGGNFKRARIWRNLARFYKPGEEIETYSSQQELLEKVEFYLTHEKERREIAHVPLAEISNVRGFGETPGIFSELLFTESSWWER